MNPRVALLGALAVAACGGDPPAAAPKVLVIGIDGVRADRLAAAPTPTLDSLIASGGWSDRATTREPTVSGPGWSSMLTGVWAEKHGVFGNDFSANAYDRYPDFLTRIEQVRPDLVTLAVLDWPPLGTAADGGPLVSDAVDRKALVDGDSVGYAAADSASAAHAAELLANTDVDAAFVYLGDVDVVGHAHGSFSEEYKAALATADGHVRTLLAGLARRPHRDTEDWLILISTDHGRDAEGRHGGGSPEELGIFVIASGPSVAARRFERDPEIVDVAVTALEHLGIGLDPAWQLDGRPLRLRPGDTAGR